MQDAIARSISREDLALLPIRRYEGPIRLVAAPQDLEQAAADIREERVVGFDTETRPSFRKGESHPACLVQAATARAVYLFQLRGPEVVPLISGLLAEPRTVKTGVALADDLRALRLLFPFEAQNVLDL